MANFEEFDNEIEKEKIKTKGKMVAITTLSIISVVVFFIGIIIYFTKSFLNDIEKHIYYFVEINDNNKEEIITLLNDENIEYCDSIYKIEYERILTGDIISKIYCNNEENISLNIYNGDSKIINYIHEYGNIEKR